MAEIFVEKVRNVSGCVECRLMTDCEVRGLYVLLSRWEDITPLRVFLGSNEFRALLGTRILLHTPPRVSVDEVQRRIRLSGQGKMMLQW